MRSHQQQAQHWRARNPHLHQPRGASSPSLSLSKKEAQCLALCVGGLQTEMGINSNGGSAAPSEESLVFTAEAERSCELGTLGTSAGGGNTCPCIQTWEEGDEEDIPNLRALPQAGWPFSRESRDFSFTLQDLRDSVSTRA